MLAISTLMMKLNGNLEVRIISPSSKTLMKLVDSLTLLSDSDQMKVGLTQMTPLAKYDKQKMLTGKCPHSRWMPDMKNWKVNIRNL